MANNPKKVKDPTEVALSAIQEALNISDGAAGDSARSSSHSDAAPANASSISTPAYNESAFDTRPSEDRQIFEPIIEPTVNAFAAAGVGRLLPAHCTGWKAVHQLARALPDAFVQPAIGTVVTF